MVKGTGSRQRPLLTVLVVALLLAAAVFVYRGVGDFDFVNLDDPDYVTENRMVRGGLSSRSRCWSSCP